MSLFSISSDRCRIHRVESGSGPAILLIHGFASNLDRNWRSTGWINALTHAGWRVIAYDQRGHGESEKRYDREDYAPGLLIDDALAVLDAAEAPAAVLMGYSMGAEIALDVAIHHRERCRALLLGGLGRNFFPVLGGSGRGYEVVAAALEADDPSRFPAAARAYRRFAAETGGDLEALAACWRRERRSASLEELSSLSAPTLVVVGDLDEVAGDGAPLARAIPGAELVALPGKDHQKAVGARGHRAAVLDFLSRLRQAR